jgi:hypothetical protein
MDLNKLQWHAVDFAGRFFAVVVPHGVIRILGVAAFGRTFPN